MSINIKMKLGKVGLKAAIGLVVFLGACGAEEEAELTDAEKERRQELTFDISGQYFADNSGQHPSSITILNENKFHDVRATYALGREFTDAEREKLRLSLQGNEQRITAQEIDVITYNLRNKLQSLALATGKTFELRGGENIVLDAKGLESELVLTSGREGFHDIAFSGTRETYFVEFSGYFTAVQADGTLNYNVTRNTDRYGQTLDNRKGTFARITRTVYSAAGSEQRTDEICTLELITGTFKK